MEKNLVHVLIVSMVLGLFYLIVDPHYRIKEIIISNSSYYPGVKDELIEKYAIKYERPKPPPRKKKYKSKYYRKKYYFDKYGRKRYYRKRYTTRKTEHYIKDKSIRVDLNSATRSELLKVPGIDSSLARKILLYRKLHKGFKSKEELRNIPGITDSVYEKIEKYLYVK